MFSLMPLFVLAGPKCFRLKEKGEADERRGCGIQAGEEAAAGHRLQQSSAGHVH